MTEDTLNLIEQKFAEFPRSRAESGVPYSEIETAARSLGIPFCSDYVEFLHRYGGGVVGGYYIVGLRPAPFMAADTTSVEALTTHYREMRWPYTSDWVIFSADQGGNPIGFDKDGLIWLSDAQYNQIVAICESFEEFLQTWCLGGEQSPEYYREVPWPDTSS